ncbi:MAG: uncharacterized protein KVP18_002808 [Porospora cf. gigantea A]|uniref:uncharacterized protein n=1 Tax=Porospora cf. gigantea A TaxID=2853593 RepID=UPI00355A81FC|nr:MAG: hypothetical protein KVP18_002808 [Porospora cf. gigantea A]
MLKFTALVLVCLALPAEDCRSRVDVAGPEKEFCKGLCDFFASDSAASFCDDRTSGISVAACIGATWSKCNFTVPHGTELTTVQQCRNLLSLDLASPIRPHCLMMCDFYGHEHGRPWCADQSSGEAIATCVGVNWSRCAFDVPGLLTTPIPEKITTAFPRPPTDPPKPPTDPPKPPTDHPIGNVCESLNIPMRSVVLGDIGDGSPSEVCAPEFLGQHAQVRMEAYAADQGLGANRYINCDQSPWQGDWGAKSDLCPAAYALCENNQCEPFRSDRPTYYEKHFGRPWTGLNTWPIATVTTYGGSAASGGTVADWAKFARECLGVDGVAAVPTMMYGDWSKGGQAAWRNNDLCYEVQSEHSPRPLTVIVIGRCGGYTYCNNVAENAQINSVLPLPREGEGYALPPGDYDNVHRSDGNVCIVTRGAVWQGGGPADCATVRSRGPNATGEAFCSDTSSLHRDWCARNDHPHLDLDSETLDLVCGSAGVSHGSCHLTSIRPKKCPWAVPKNASGESGSKSFQPVTGVGMGKCPTGLVIAGTCDGVSLDANSACWKSRAQWWLHEADFHNFTVYDENCCTEGVASGFVFVKGGTAQYDVERAKAIARQGNVTGV